MSQEIVYTSAPKGLKPGSRGFCTVVSTEGMAGNLADRLESHSGYRHAFGVNDERRDFNPVNWSHTTMRVAGTQFHVLSRVSDAGLDYSGRSNKLAHHVALDVSELPAAGPARTLLAPGVIRREWSGEIGLVARRKLPEIPIPRSYQAATWRRAAGDSAWAGVVAEKLLESNTPLSIIFAIQTDTMSLLTEVLDLIPLKQRWSISFSTYFTQLAPGTECRLRFVLDDTLEATALRKNPHAAVIDLTLKPTAPGGGELAECARSSQLPEHSLPPGPASPAHCPEAASDKAQARRDRPASAVEEVYDANWDESDGQEDVGEYQLKQSEPSHTHLLEKPQKPTRQSAYEMPGRPPRQLRTAGIIGGVVVGLALFVSVSFLLIQRLRGSGTDPVSPNLIAGNMPAPPANKARPDKVIATSKLEMDTTPERDANRSELKSASATGPSMDNLLTSKTPDGTKLVEGATTGTVESKSAARSPGKKENAPEASTKVPANPTPERPEVNPFDQLPPDGLDSTHALLDLNAMPEGGWHFVTDDPGLLKLEILGSEAFIRETVGKFHLTSSEADGLRVWNLMLDVKNSDLADLGQFRLSTSDKKTTLTFHSTKSVVQPPEASVIKFLALGLTLGKHKRLCRLGNIQPKRLLPIHFSKEGGSESEIPIELDEVLISLLKENDSKLSVGLKFVGNITDYLIDGKDEFQDLHVNAPRIIFLSADRHSKSTEEWSLFSDDPNLVELNIKSKVSKASIKGSLNIQLSAFASFSLFSTEPEYFEAAKNAKLGSLQVPRVKIPLASNALQRRLNRRVGRSLTDVMQKTIDELNNIKMQCENKLSMNMNDELAKKHLATAKEKLVAFELQKKRHAPDSLTWLWTLLSGGENAGSKVDEDSIRGAIGSAKVGLKIAYNCKFAGESLAVVVYEASK